jgi:hypothetical protein
MGPIILILLKNEQILVLMETIKKVMLMKFETYTLYSIEFESNKLQYCKLSALFF